MKFLTLIIFAFSMTFQAQDIKEHQWVDRVIVVSSPTFNHALAKKQLEELASNPQDLNERKVVVYHYTNNGYTFNFSTKIYASEKLKESISTFSVKLFGLDGSEKFKANKVTSTSTFLDLIDSMPMRKTELQRKNR